MMKPKKKPRVGDGPSRLALFSSWIVLAVRHDGTLADWLQAAANPVTRSLLYSGTGCKQLDRAVLNGTQKRRQLRQTERFFGHSDERIDHGVAETQRDDQTNENRRRTFLLTHLTPSIPSRGYNRITRAHV